MELRAAVRQAGYEVVDGDTSPVESGSRQDNGLRMLGWPVLIGGLAALLLAGLYFGVVTVLQSWSHAVELVTADWYFVAAIAAGFGTQVGLFVHIRRRHKACQTRSSNALTGAGTGTSTVAMLACCAHHATDVLPLIGLSGAAVFLTEYRVPFMILGVASNVFGVAFMLRMLRRQKGHHNAV
jgi:hypothetical protein